MDDYSPSATCGSSVHGKAPGKPSRDEDSDESESVSLEEIVEDNEDQVDEDNEYYNNGNNDGREETGQSGLMNRFHGRSLVPDSASNLSAPPVGATLHEHGERQIHSDTMVTSNFVSASMELPVYYPPDDGTDGFRVVENSSLPMRSQPLNVDHVTATWSRDDNRRSPGPPPTSVPPASAAGRLSDSETQLPEVLWDTPGSTNVLAEYNCQSCCDTAMSVLKLITYIVIFCSVVVLTMFSNGTLLLAASNLRPPSNYKQDQGALRCVAKSQGPQNLFCVALPRNKSGEYSTSGLTCLPPEVWEANECSVHRAMWGWSLFMMVCMPYAFVFIRNLRRVINGKYRRKVNWNTLGIVLIVETMYAVGISLLVFVVLPSVDNVLEGLIVSYGVSLGPSIMRVLFKPNRSNTDDDEDLFSAHFSWVTWHADLLDALAAILQLSVVVAYVVVSAINENYDVTWSVPVALVLISFRSWENYFDRMSAVNCLVPVVRRLAPLARKARRSRVVIQLYTSVWKSAVTLLMMFLTTSHHMSFVDSFVNRWTLAFDIDNSKYCRNTSGVLSVSSEQIAEMELDWLWVWLIQVCSALTCYFFARSAAKMRIQRLCYALPLNLATPITYVILAVMCAMWNDKPCVFAETFPGYLFFKCHRQDDPLIYSLWPVMTLLWGISQLWITRHVWKEHVYRLAPADRLFVLPLYDVIVDKSLLVNRVLKLQWKTSRIEYNVAEPVNVKKDQAVNGTSRSVRPSRWSMQAGELSNDDIREFMPKIYLCATMWHETREEMVTLLKSIFKLDKDQKIRSSRLNSTSDDTSDDYQFEAHVFFDNAMATSAEDSKLEINFFVRTFINAVTQAAISTYDNDKSPLRTPLKYNTPYGGRLVWTMKGGNLLVVHLKDNTKIKNKKRWSQVMYMYYFLHHKMTTDFQKTSSGDGGDRVLFRQQMRAENTFILALDGDIDFEPTAVLLLIDLMRRDLRVGAACGRIHPTGSGPIVWYQQFEYAMGHWMQKATEHVIGCVLCSPGCFSLFRGSALIDDIAVKYSTPPTQPTNYIQYDQGEDRWLCTLMLQQGYRVEYCAAANSYTRSPENFKEFFNQRRRWIPSTLANTIDLLWSWRSTTRRNENLSMAYIIYQFLLFVIAVFGPGTILLMIAGAMQLAISNFVSVSILITCGANLVPVVVFIFVCFFAKSDIQVKFAWCLAIIYAFIQVLVIVGVVASVINTTPVYCNSNAIFLFLVLGVFAVCGLLHPLELLTLTAKGIVYYLYIPAMCLLLMIYAICNLNVISWGTREKNNDDGGTGDVTASSDSPDAREDHGPRELSTSWYSCCAQRSGKYNVEEAREKYYNSSSTTAVNGIDVDAGCCLCSKTTWTYHFDRDTRSSTQVIVTAEDNSSTFPVPVTAADKKLWSEVSGETLELPEAERKFFQELVNTCLNPDTEENNNENTSHLNEKLRRMRNKYSAAFLVTNGLFIALVVALESFAEEIGVPWLPGVCTNSNPKIQPLGFVFLGLFGFVMVIQTIGMIIHRVGTFIHTMSISDVRCGRRTMQDVVWREQQLQFAAATRRRCTSAVVPNSPNRGGDESESDSDSDDDEFYLQPVNRRSRMHRPSVLPPVSGSGSGYGRSVSHISTMSVDSELGPEDVNLEQTSRAVNGRSRSVRFVSVTSTS